MKFKRSIAGFLAMICIAGCLSGCNNGGESGNHSASAIEVAKSVVSNDTTLPEMKTVTSKDENAALNFSAFCDLDYSKVVEFSRSFAKAGGADEIIVVCVNSESDVNAVLSSLKKYQESRRGTMQEYMPEEVSKVDDAILTYKGCYVALFISKKSGLCKQKFEEELKANGI